MPMCVLCQKTLGNDYMKPSLFTRHLKRAHPEFKDKELFCVLVISRPKITQLTY